MNEPDRVVFDCNVYFQAFISDTGPAGQLLRAVSERKLSLFLSEFILDELRNVLTRPHLVAKFRFTGERVATYLGLLAELTTMVADVPHVFDFPRDPNDEHYVDLALAVQAHLIVSRDKDLLALNDSSSGEATAFRIRFPKLLVLTPPELLMRLRNNL